MFVNDLWDVRELIWDVNEMILDVCELVVCEIICGWIDCILDRINLYFELFIFVCREMVIGSFYFNSEE